MPRIIRPLLLGALSLLVLISACTATTAPAAPLRIGINIWSGYAPFLIAEQQDLYAPQPVQTTTFSSLYDSDRAFAQGRIDALGTTLFDALRLHDEGVPFKIVMVIDYSNGADGIVAREGSAEVADLKGKRVAAEVGTANHFVLLTALEREGLTEQDVQLINLTVDESSQAFEQGRVDAAVLWDPYLSQQAARPEVELIFSSSEIPGRIIDVLLVRQEALEQRATAVAQVIEGWNKALQIWHSQPADVLAEIAPALENTPQGLQADLERLVLVNLEENLALFDPAQEGSLHDTLRSTAEFMQEHQLLRQSAPQPQDILEPRFLGDSAGP